MNPELVVGALQRLQQQMSNLRCRARELSKAENSGDLAIAVLATEGTRQALGTSGMTMVYETQQT
jgi:hypothetical protein